MELFYQVILILTGVYLVAGSLTVHTKNLLSAILFKIIPFFLGLGCLFSAAKLLRWY